MSEHIVTVTPGITIAGIPRAIAECSICGVIIGGASAIVIPMAVEHNTNGGF